MSLKNSYFALPSPFAMLERWLNPESYFGEVSLKGIRVNVHWTKRAERQLAKLTSPLLVEMQLYFSCVVKKRVLFHERGESDGVDGTVLDKRLRIAFRPVEANSCDPVEFANNFPVRREFETASAIKMHPRSLHLDYKNNQWLGEFKV